MLIEKRNAIFPLCHSIFFQLFSIFSPFTVFQMPQPPMTSGKGFIHIFRFSNVRNKIIEVTKAKKN